MKNAFTERYLKAEFGHTPKEELTKMSVGTNRRAAIDGDIENGAVQCGQSLNRLQRIEPAKAIVDSVISEAKAAIKRAQQYAE